MVTRGTGSPPVGRRANAAQHLPVLFARLPRSQMGARQHTLGLRHGGRGVEGCAPQPLVRAVQGSAGA